MRTLAAVLLLFCVATTAVAQGSFAGANWTIGFPTGRTNDFISKTSFGGMGVDIKRFFDDNATYGLNFGWSQYSEMVNETATWPSGALSGTQIRYLNLFPISLNADIYFGEKRDELKTFAGLNAGAVMVRMRDDIGIYSFESTSWHFMLAPEIGFWFPVERGTYVTISARYNYAFDNGIDVFGNDVNKHSWVSLNIGLGWMQDWF